MLKKRGQGLPMNTIVVAALVLIVLVVLLLAFTGRIDLFKKSVNSCGILAGGSCKTPVSQDKPCEEGWGAVPDVGECGADKVCCIPLKVELGNG
ncbi:MAG: hypothetical protein ABIH34_05695 [Nanoarchaeota archaeon]